MNTRLPGRAGLIAAIALLACVPIHAAGYAGKPLSEALTDLRAQGLKIVFTSEVVRPEMTVIAEPVATEPRRILDEILEPHGLMARDGPRDTLVIVQRTAELPSRRGSISGLVLSRAGSVPVAGAVVRVLESGAVTTSTIDGGFLFEEHDAGSFTIEAGRAGFAIARVEEVSVVAGERTEISILLNPAPIVEEEVEITPSRISLMREEPGAVIGLGREEILALPHLGDDFFRAISLLPGISANDVSAQFHVRGGRRDETQILLDGQELYEPYHLKDFDNALSFVSTSALASADLTTGGFPAEFGDRMSGVLDMRTVTPAGRPRGRVGASLLNLQAGGSGGFHGDRGSWLLEARRGTADLAKELLGNEHPRYADIYAKIEYQLNRRNSIGVNLLYSDDRFTFEEVLEDESKRTDTSYNSGYLWLTHRAVLGSRIFLETVFSRASLDQERYGVAFEEDVEFEIFDGRETEVTGLRQSWNFRATPGHLLKWGFEVRRFDTEYDYAGNFVFDNPLAAIRETPEEGETLFAGEYDESHTSLYIADRMRLTEAVTLELGLRHDRHSLTDENHFSPRFNLAWAPDDASVFRFAIGTFHQSQRPYELQVEDGESAFHPTELSEHRVLGYEREFAVGLSLRAELYERTVPNPRPRYENLYEAINTFPEVEPDRVRIAPERSVARGFELFIRGKAGKRVGWWANYAYASTEDEIDGVWVPRKFDQRHTLNLDLNYLIGKHWKLNLAWRYHSGWPTTPLWLEEEDDGDWGPVLGPLYSERLPAYHRLDLRASRSFRVGGGELILFFDVQNLYDRNNIAGSDNHIDEEEGTIETEIEYWAGILPSVGITYEF
jgi:hypothetical protein